MIELGGIESYIRIFVSLIAGVMIGLMRAKYPAGIRTFTLICIGATVFTLISIDPAFTGSDSDPTRVISQIVTGIGFIGAGVIWKSTTRLAGLTTAAAIWSTAAVGILVGLGEFGLALFTTIIVMAVLFSKQIWPQI
jgi:putative Mg2+ transporter-C (MgtC) family protein